jgi:predicted metal-dependent hydrolase
MFDLTLKYEIIMATTKYNYIYILCQFSMICCRPLHAGRRNVPLAQSELGKAAALL